MRMRLGLLHDAEAQQRMYEREQKAAEEKKKKAESPTVRSEEEQRKYEEQKAKDEREGTKKKKDEQPKVKIRPLSDTRAIELGANFFSETFIFMVAVGLLLAENYRSSRKASNRRDEVQERLDTLEEAVERLRNEHHLPELEALNERIKKAREIKLSWYNPAGWWRRAAPEQSDGEGEGTPGETEGSGNGNRIAGNVPGPPPEKAIKPKDSTGASTDAKVVEATPKSAPARVDTVNATKKER